MVGGLRGHGTSPEQIYLMSHLVGHMQAIHATLQVVEQTPTENVPRIGWGKVLSKCEKLCLQATIVGFLWIGRGPPDVENFKNHMKEFFGLLQEVRVLVHRATVGGGPTLNGFILTSVKQVAEVGVKLMKLSIYSYGAPEERVGDVLSKAIADVWRAWNALKETPSNNIAAIGRTVTQVAASIQESLRVMKELKASFNSPQVDKAKASTEAESSKKEASGNAGGSTKKMKEASANLPVEVKSEASGEAARSSKDKNESDVDDVSPEEIRIAGDIIDVTSGALDMMNKLIQVIMGLLKKEKEGALAEYVNSLEKICELSQHIGTKIKELGSCIAPPQDISAIKPALMEIAHALTVIILRVQRVGGATRDFIDTCKNLMDLTKWIKTELTSGAD